MSLPYADTSFLVSLYGNDVHSAKARTWSVTRRHKIAITPLCRFEFENALRFAAFRGVIAAGDAHSSIAALQADVNAGFLNQSICDLNDVISEAAELSEKYALSGGHRSFDILHVATATTLKASEFLTFDANQRRLAIRAGLSVAP